MMNTKANRIALIPARLESERLPEKLLLPLGGLPIIVCTYRAVLATNLFDKVVVICNHSKIAAALEEHNCKYIYNDTHFESGTDRIANELHQFPYEVIVNVQGDEPFIEEGSLKLIVELFDSEEVEVSTLKYKIKSKSDFDNPNIVKIVCNEYGRALFFSRSPIPFFRGKGEGLNCYRHIGVYGYRRSALLKLSKLKPSPLELAEKLENLRMIEHGFHVGVAEVMDPPLSIDTQQNYEEAVARMAAKA